MLDFLVALPYNRVSPFERDKNLIERYIMSNLVNEIFLEQKFEEGLALGMTDAEAEAYANKCFEEQGV